MIKLSNLRNKLIFFIGLITLISCKEKIPGPGFDSLKISDLMVYSYEYDFDKLKSESVKSCIYMNGIVIDSFNRKTSYFYNSNGLKEKEISYLSNEKEPSVRLYRYDSNDSIILDLTINEEKDTLYWSEFKYFPDGKRIVFKRDLIPGFANDPGLINDLENSTMDTIMYRFKFDYIDNKCAVSHQFDKNNKRIKLIRYSYQNDILTKETHFNCVNSIELFEKIKHYYYSKSENKPDFYSVDSNNDTIEFCINLFESDKLIKTSQMYEYGKDFKEDYFENALLVRSVSYDRQFTMNKITDVIAYNENGLIKSVRTFREKINAN
jgi:hypothetical protein